MAQILVTGGTGTLGRHVVTNLRETGDDVRVLSRRVGVGDLTGDLLTGVGIAAALRGVDTVVHLATGRHDDEATRVLVTMAEATRVEHLVLVSIVGVDQIPLPYYRRKLMAEQHVIASALPYTILRATQFHELVAGLFSAQRRLPALLTPGFALQPIAAGEVAARLRVLCAGAPAGRVDDIGGPEVLPGRALAQLWLESAGERRRVWPLRLPGGAYAAYAAGHNLVPGPAYGEQTFREHLAEVHAGRGRPAAGRTPADRLPERRADLSRSS